MAAQQASWRPKYDWVKKQTREYRCICVEVETMMEEKAEADSLFDRKSKIDSSIEARRQWTEKGQRQVNKVSGKTK